MVQDDVPPRGQFADLRDLDLGKVEAEGLVALGVASPDLLELAVPLVPWVALHEALGREQLLVPLPDPRVDMRRGAASVGDRLVRLEVVFAGRAGQESGVPLKVRFKG